MRYIRTKKGVVLVALDDLIQIVQKERPVDRPAEHRGPYIFENGKRNACDAILRELAYIKRKAGRESGKAS